MTEILKKELQADNYKVEAKNQVKKLFEIVLLHVVHICKSKKNKKKNQEFFMFPEFNLDKKFNLLTFYFHDISF